MYLKRKESAAYGILDEYAAGMFSPVISIVFSLSRDASCVVPSQFLDCATYGAYVALRSTMRLDW